MSIRDRPEVLVSQILRPGTRCLIAVIPAAIVAQLVAALPVIAGLGLAAVVTGAAAGILVDLPVLPPDADRSRAGRGRAVRAAMDRAGKPSALSSTSSVRLADGPNGRGFR